MLCMLCRSEAPGEAAAASSNAFQQAVACGFDMRRRYVMVRMEFITDCKSSTGQNETGPPVALREGTFRRVCKFTEA